jgi:hypothetical protein
VRARRHRGGRRRRRRNTYSTSSCVELSHTMRSLPKRTASSTHAESLRGLKPAATNTFVSSTAPPHLTSIAVRSANPRPSAAAGCSNQPVDERDACDVLLACPHAGSRRANRSLRATSRGRMGGRIAAGAHNQPPRTARPSLPAVRRRRLCESAPIRDHGRVI